MSWHSGSPLIYNHVSYLYVLTSIDSGCQQQPPPKPIKLAWVRVLLLLLLGFFCLWIPSGDGAVPQIQLAELFHNSYRWRCKGSGGNIFSFSMCIQDQD